MGKIGRGIGIYVLMFVFVAVVLMALRDNSGGSSKEDQYTYNNLLEQLAKNEVKKLEITSDAEVSNTGLVRVYFHDPNRPVERVDLLALDNFTAIANEASKESGYQLEIVTVSAPKTSLFIQFIPYIIMVVVFIFLIFFILQQMQNSGGGNRMMNFGKSRARMVNYDKKKITFENVAGLEEEKEELSEIVEFLKDPKKFIDIGARIPKGVLLIGSPGTGKTYLAKAVSGEAGVPFFSISGSDFVEMFVGVGASRVRDLFEQAKKHSPCIVFIDEIDAVGRRRGAGLGGGHDEREQTLNQLLVEMDGFGVNEGVIILAATNRPDILDPALLRPGRFDRQVAVGKPDMKAREAILNIHAKSKQMSKNADLGIMAKTTPGFTPADLENLLNEAALLSVRSGKKEIDMEELRRAFVKIGVGTEKKSHIVSKKERRITAYHEGGHSIIQEMLDELDPVHIVSAIPTGRTGGYTMSLPSEDKSHITKKYMEQTIVALLGGRAAEFVVLKDITTGASNDIERASAIARSMVMKYGMSDVLGPIQFGDDNEEVFLGRDLAHARNYGEQVASLIDNEIKRIVEDSYQEAIAIVTKHIDVLHKTADLLMDKEKITGDEFRKLFPEGVLQKDKAEDEFDLGLFIGTESPAF